MTQDYDADIFCKWTLAVQQTVVYVGVQMQREG